MTSFIVGLILQYSSIYGVNPVLALAVAQVESGFNPSVVSQTFDYGVFQLNRGSFKGYSEEQLLDPETNVKLGIKYLKTMQKECVHQEGIDFLVCWNYGIRNAKRVKHASLFPFVKKVRRAMHEIQFKEGEKVIVIGLYELRTDGYGTYLGVSSEPHYEGYYRVENEMGHVMRIHPNRVKKAEEK